MTIYNETDFRLAWSSLSPEEQTKVISLARQRCGIPERLTSGVVGQHEFTENSPTLKAAIKLVLREEMAGQSQLEIG